MFSGNSKKKSAAKPGHKNKIKKRNIEESDNEEQESKKRSKTEKFNVQKWMTLLLPNLHYTNPDEFAVKTRCIKKLAAIIAASAERLAWMMKLTSPN